MALNSRRLLESLGIAKVSIVGALHGGMLAARFAASFPDITERAVLDLPYRADGHPLRAAVARSADEAYKATMAQIDRSTLAGIYANIRRYFPSPGALKPEYEKYVRILYAPTLRRRLAPAGDGALDLPADAISRPGRSTTGEDQAEDAGDRRGEGRRRIFRSSRSTSPTRFQAELVILPNLGHVPHVEAPELFYLLLLSLERRIDWSRRPC